VESRNAVCREVVLVSVAGIAAAVNHLARLRLDRRFGALRRATDRVRGRAVGPQPARLFGSARRSGPGPAALRRPSPPVG
jgi:hypothetical protein